MKTKILAQFYAFLVLLMPGLAWAQQTPTPIFWSNANMSVHSSVTGVQVETVQCQTVDMAGFSDLIVRTNIQGCNRVLVDVLNTTDPCNGASISPRVAINQQVVFGITSNTTGVISSERVDVIGGIGRKVIIRAIYRPAAVVPPVPPCTATVYIQPTVSTHMQAMSGRMDGRNQYSVGPMYTSIAVDYNGDVQVAGPYEAGALLSSITSASNPVLVGGSDGTRARMLKTDTSGNLSAGGVAADGAAVAGNPVMVAGSDGTNVRTVKTDANGNLGIAAPLPGPTLLDIHAPVAYQVTKLATTTVASPVGAGVIWKVRVQNLGGDELMIANVDPPTEAVSHRVQAGGDVWEVEWKDALYMKLKADAATSPQVTPDDVRVTVMHY